MLPPKGEILVGSKLAQIGSSGTLIFGEVQPPKKPNPSLAGSRTPGFFTGFVKTINDWCTAHHMNLTGHADQEEVVNPVVGTVICLFFEP